MEKIKTLVESKVVFLIDIYIDARSTNAQVRTVK